MILRGRRIRYKCENPETAETSIRTETAGSVPRPNRPHPGRAPRPSPAGRTPLADAHGHRPARVLHAALPEIDVPYGAVCRAASATLARSVEENRSRTQDTARQSWSPLGGKGYSFVPQVTRRGCAPILTHSVAGQMPPQNAGCRSVRKTGLAGLHSHRRPVHDETHCRMLAIAVLLPQHPLHDRTHRLSLLGTVPVPVQQKTLATDLAANIATNVRRTTFDGHVHALRKS